MNLGYLFIKLKQLVYKNKQVKQSSNCGLNLGSVDFLFFGSSLQCLGQGLQNGGVT